MFLFDALKGRLTLEVRPVTHLMNTDLVVITRGKTLGLHILRIRL
jgi:hypothetical protein